MYCKYCGAPLEDGAKFCISCGKQADQEPATHGESEVVVERVQEDPRIKSVKDARKKSILTYAILSLVFSEIAIGVASSLITLIAEGGDVGVCFVMLLVTLPLAIISCVFAFRTSKYAKRYEADFGEISGRGKVGKIMSIPARIMGVAALALYLLAILSCM